MFNNSGFLHPEIPRANQAHIHSMNFSSIPLPSITHDSRVDCRSTSLGGIRIFWAAYGRFGAIRSIRNSAARLPSASSLIHRSKRDRQHIRKANIARANQCNILRHSQSCLQNRLQRPNGDRIVITENSVRPRLRLQQFPHPFIPSTIGMPGGDHVTPDPDACRLS